MTTNHKTLADRARWFADHLTDPNAKGIFDFAARLGVTRPTDPDDLDQRLDAAKAGDLGALQDDYDAKTAP